MSERRKLGAALGQLIEVVGRPVRLTVTKAGISVQPYRGYGSWQRVFLIGRVFRQPLTRRRRPRRGFHGRLADVVLRFLRRGVGDAQLIARFHGAEQVVEADRDGYFRVDLSLPNGPIPAGLWHEMTLELVRPVRLTTRGELFLAPPDARQMVISDIDDTIMSTGVANKILMLWRLFMTGAHSRAAFPGMAALLAGLHHGASGREANPLLYVSRSPWAIYEMLEEFFSLHRIPGGPILFLREWGVTVQRPWPRRARRHKLELIRRMLALYDQLPCILIGDSGQEDPEHYTQILREHPGRVRVIYIRNVSRDPARHAAIRALAEEVEAAGSSLILAADSFVMAEHAAEQGLIAAAAKAAVLAERAEAAAVAGAPPVETDAALRTVSAQELQAGGLEATLTRGPASQPPPGVAIEPTTGGSAAPAAKNDAADWALDEAGR